MECKYFGECGSCRLYNLSYSEQVNQKKAYMKELFPSFEINDFEFFTSREEHYRNRAEFRIWHESDKISYGMHKLQDKGILRIEECPKVDEEIYLLMPKLKRFLQDNDELREKLYGIEFLSSKNGMLVTLIYHKQINQIWRQEAKKIEDKFGIFIIGRAKKLKEVLTQEFILENLQIQDKNYIYKIIEGGFSQPNRCTNEKMIEWVCLNVKDTKDLLELYCGHGNFTLPLSSKFENILATEISKTSIKSALNSCKLNNVNKIKFLRMRVEELTSALNKEREFNRLKDINLDDYSFSHVLTDPPRAGIDEKSLEFISHFKNIIYISCNPITLKRDLEFLLKEFNIMDFAIFDQFPYTNHIESGIILSKKE
ncbi:MAG: tRNA (uridine(54)-C5)-methyltransferase TrmA [Campylobacteraceae bacterium]|nr:tRNA (uridine(54)-C5)-methyltransferase TrmA [Campylobacteraceae bacterium]